MACARVAFGIGLCVLITSGGAAADCRYRTGEEPAEGRMRPDLFPEDDLFRPLLADGKQLRFAAGYRRMEFSSAPLPTERVESDAVDASALAAGGDFGLWTLRRQGGCDGFQVNIAGGVFTWLNHAIKATTVMDSDFIVGIPVTFRQGRFSARVFLLHQSSHLGDEFLYQIPDFTPVNLGYEQILAHVSYEDHWWRVYGGSGFFAFSRPTLARWSLQGGVELRGPTWEGLVIPGVDHTPVFGVDVTSYEARDWGMTTSLKGGIEVAGPEARHRFRILGVYQGGYTPFGQFFVLQRMQTIGVESQLEF